MLVALLACALTFPLVSSISIVSVSPAWGTTNVTNGVTCIVTFSQTVSLTPGSQVVTLRGRNATGDEVDTQWLNTSALWLGDGNTTLRFTPMLMNNLVYRVELETGLVRPFVAPTPHMPGPPTEMDNTTTPTSTPTPTPVVAPPAPFQGLTGDTWEFATAGAAVVNSTVYTLVLDSQVEDFDADKFCQVVLQLLDRPLPCANIKIMVTEGSTVVTFSFVGLPADFTQLTQATVDTKTAVDMSAALATQAITGFVASSFAAAGAAMPVTGLDVSTTAAAGASDAVGASTNIVVSFTTAAALASGSVEITLPTDFPALAAALTAAIAEVPTGTVGPVTFANDRVITIPFDSAADPDPTSFTITVGPVTMPASCGSMNGWLWSVALTGPLPGTDLAHYGHANAASDTCAGQSGVTPNTAPQVWHNKGGAEAWEGNRLKLTHPVDIQDNAPDNEPLYISLSAGRADSMLFIHSAPGITDLVGSGTSALTFSANQSNLDIALSTIEYEAVAEYEGADTITLVVDDRGNCCEDDNHLQTTLVIPVNVLGVNTAPTITAGVGTITIGEDAASLSQNPSDMATNVSFTIADIDAGSNRMMVVLEGDGVQMRWNTTHHSPADSKAYGTCGATCTYPEILTEAAMTDGTRCSLGVAGACYIAETQGGCVSQAGSGACTPSTYTKRMVFVGSLAALNAGPLKHIDAFQNSRGFTTATLTATVHDLGFGPRTFDGTGGVNVLDNVLSASAVTTFNVVPRNDAPASIALTPTDIDINEGSTASVAFVISDPDDPDLTLPNEFHLYFTSKYGVVTLPSAPAGVTATTSGPVADLYTYSFKGSLGDLAASSPFVWAARDADYYGGSGSSTAQYPDEELQMYLVDTNAHPTGTATGPAANTVTTGPIDVLVRGVNDAPYFTGPATMTHHRDDAAEFMGTNAVTIVDVDAHTNAGIDLIISTQNGTLEIDAASAGISLANTKATSNNGAESGDANHIRLRGTVAQLNAALLTLEFRSTYPKEKPIYHITDPVHDVATVYFEVIDNGATAHTNTGPLSGLHSVEVTVTATLYATCQDYIDDPNAAESEVCGCYFRAPAQGVPTDGLWTKLPTDLASTTFENLITGGRKFMQGCCAEMNAVYRDQILDRVNELAACTVEML